MTFVSGHCACINSDTDTAGDNEYNEFTDLEPYRTRLAEYRVHMCHWDKYAERSFTYADVDCFHGSGVHGMDKGAVADVAHPECLTMAFRLGLQMPTATMFERSGTLSLWSIVNSTRVSVSDGDVISRVGFGHFCFESDDKPDDKSDDKPHDDSDSGRDVLFMTELINATEHMLPPCVHGDESQSQRWAHAKNSFARNLLRYSRQALPVELCLMVA